MPPHRKSNIKFHFLNYIVVSMLSAVAASSPLEPDGPLLEGTITVRTGAKRELKTTGEVKARWLQPSTLPRNAFTTRIWKKQHIFNTMTCQENCDFNVPKSRGSICDRPSRLREVPRKFKSLISLILWWWVLPWIIKSLDRKLMITWDVSCMLIG